MNYWRALISRSLVDTCMPSLCEGEQSLRTRGESGDQYTESDEDRELVSVVIILHLLVERSSKGHAVMVWKVQQSR